MPTRKRTIAKGTTATASKKAADTRGFRKANEAIGLRVREGRLSLLARKIFNVMMYHAQELRTPGMNAPIDTPAARRYFWIPLSDLARDAAYDSKDTEFLKQQLEELQNIKLLMENERQWTSERLVASVTFVNPLGLRKHAGQVWLGYAFPPEVHELVMAPGTYTRFSIFYQGLLRSGAALALYEVCRRYATNPSRVTLVEGYEHWYAVLSGNPVPAEALPPYKYFKRDVVKPAMAEINALTDIRVELVEHRNGRRIERLQFRVEKTRQAPVALLASPVIDVETLQRLAKLGFNQQEASDFMLCHPEELLRECLAAAETRIEQHDSAPIESPAAYFRWLLKKGVADRPDEVTSTVAGAAVAAAVPGSTVPAAVIDRFLASRAKDALAAYAQLGADERRDLFERFRQHSPASRTLKHARGIENTLVRSLFSHWYAREIWGAPGAQALADFVAHFTADEG